MNWLEWQPPIIRNSQGHKPTKPTEPGFDGFVGSHPGQNQIIEARLQAAGISIAIDRATGAALLIFNESNAEAVRDVATVHKPFEIELTPAQRREVTRYVNYYERLMERKANRHS